ncbi:MAG: glycosyltransferase [Pseudomonadota bacterium]
MRVLQFGRFWHAAHGGIERQAALLSMSLADAGVDVVNLVASADTQPSDVQVAPRYRLVQTPSYGMFASTALSPALLLRAGQLHREKPFDLVHLHFPDPLSHLAALQFPRTVRRVVTWHSDVVRQQRLLALYRPFMQHFVRNSDAVVAATQAHFDSSTQIPASLPQSKRHVIPYGLDFGTLALDARTTRLSAELRQVAAGRALVFALGRHVYYKGFDVLVEAMRQVDALLVLGGDGPLRPQLQAQVAAAGLGDRVVFPGRIPEPDLPAYFNACDIFCLPSVERSEAFGLVQLEAMACGKPVVNTQLHNGVNVVNVEGETGWTVPVRDAAALAGALNGLARNPALRQRMGEAGRARAFGEYSLASMAQRHVQLYEGLLAEGKKA